MDWPTIVVTSGVSAFAAFLGAYLSKLAERHVIARTLEKIEKQLADINESARVRWMKRSEVIAPLYGNLIRSARAFRYYLSPGTVSSPEEIERLTEDARKFDDHFAETALFLPPEIKDKVEWIANEFLQINSDTNTTFDSNLNPDPERKESPNEFDLPRGHYKRKSEHLKRFQDGGDIAQRIEEVEKELRKLLEI